MTEVKFQRDSSGSNNLAMLKILEPDVQGPDCPFLTGNAIFQTGKRLFPILNDAFKTGKEVFPVFDGHFPIFEGLFPILDGRFKTLESLVNALNGPFNVLKKVFSVRKITKKAVEVAL